MKKTKMISASLGFLGVLMIAAAIILQYHAFQINDTEKAYQKVAMKDMADGIVVETVTNDEITTKTEEINEENIEESKNTVEPTEEVVVEDEIKEITTYEDVSTIPVDPIVYDGLTLNQLAEKLNRSLKAEVSGKGYLIASHALELGVDPYLATAIMLHETGCNSGKCSTLVTSCNNVGGQKGGPSCGNGSYKVFPTLDEGIIGFIDNLYNNYVAYGLTTAETMNSKYAASTTWAAQVNNYIAMIRSN